MSTVDESKVEGNEDTEYSQYTTRADVQAVIHALANVKTFKELTAWLARSMLTSPFLDWPQYRGTLGEDSGGGTKLADYIALNDIGVLTLNSQDGFCDPIDHKSPLSARFLKHVEETLHRTIPVADIVSSREEQISWVECMMRIRDFSDLIPLLTGPNSDLVTHVVYHPQLSPQYVYKAANKAGDLVVLDGFPKWTTSVIQLRSGETIYFPTPLRKENLAHVPTSLSDLRLPATRPAGQQRVANTYHQDLMRNFIEWESSVIPRLQLDQSLLFDLANGPYVACVFTMTEKCTFPHSAAVSLLKMLQTVRAQRQQPVRQARPVEPVVVAYHRMRRSSVKPPLFVR